MLSVTKHALFIGYVVVSLAKALWDDFICAKDDNKQLIYELPSQTISLEYWRLETIKQTWRVDNYSLLTGFVAVR